MDYLQLTFGWVAFLFALNRKKPDGISAIGLLGKGYKKNPEQTAPNHENIPRFLMAVCSERIAKTQLDRVKHAIST